MPFGFVLSDKVKSFLFQLLFAAMAALAVWGVFQMFQAKNQKIDNLSQQVTTKDGQIKTLETEKEQLKEELLKKGKSDTATEATKAVVKQKEVAVEKAKTTANQYVEKKLSDIDAKYAKQPQTPESAERKRVEISLERAKGLWLTFCLQEPAEAACK